MKGLMKAAIGLGGVLVIIFIAFLTLFSYENFSPLPSLISAQGCDPLPTCTDPCTRLSFAQCECVPITGGSCSLPGETGVCSGGICEPCGGAGELCCGIQTRGTCDSGSYCNDGGGSGTCVSCNCRFYDRVDVYVAFEAFRIASEKNIYVARSINNSKGSFDIVTQVNDITGITNRLSPDMAVAAGNIYVVWEDERGPIGIYFSKSTNRAQTFLANTNLHTISSLGATPAIAVHPANSNKIYIVWDNNADNQIYLRNSSDSGSTWEPARAITTSADAKENPDISVDSSGNIYVVYKRTTGGLIHNHDIYFVRSTNGGVSFSSEILVDDDSSVALRRPAIAVTDNAALHVVYDYGTGTSSDTLYKNSTDQGSTWSARQRIGDSTTVAQRNIEIADYNNNVYAVFEDLSSTTSVVANILSDRTPPFGTPWNTDVLASTDSSGDQQNPTIIADHQGILYSAWFDNRTVTTGCDASGIEHKVYVSRSTTLAGRWSSGQLVDDQKNLSILCDNENKQPRPVIGVSPIICGPAQCGGATCGGFAKCQIQLCDDSASSCSEGAEQCVATTQCDSAPPTTTISPDGTGWINTDQTFTLSCNDGSNGIGCHTTLYRIVNEGDICTTGPVGYTIGLSGTVTCPAGSVCRQQVCYYSNDTLSNTEPPRRSSTFQIDKQAPVTTISPDGSGGWRNTPAPFTLSCDDLGRSGCDRSYYQIIDDGGTCPVTGYTSGPVGGGASGTADCAGAQLVCHRRVCYYSNDSTTPSQNKEPTRLSNVFDIDKEAPTTTITLNPLLPDGLDGWYRVDVGVTLNCADGSGSGCRQTWYCIDQANTCTPNILCLSSPCTFTAVTEGINYVRYYSNDNAGNTEGTIPQQIKIDKTDPVYDSPIFNITGCDAVDTSDPNNKICWVSGGESLNLTVQHTDTVSTPYQQFLTFTYNGCTPNACGCSWDAECITAAEVKSDYLVDTNQFRDRMWNDTFINITHNTSCVQSGGCLGTIAKVNWTVRIGAVPPEDRNYKAWVFMYDEAGRGIGYTPVNWWVNIQVSPGPRVSVTGAPPSWTNQSATANVSCTPSGPACDIPTARLLLYTSNPNQCPADWSAYNLPAPQTITSYRWVCGTENDTADNSGFSSPTEFRIDTQPPTSETDSIEPIFEVAPNYFWTNQTHFTVNWTGGDDLSGINTYQVQYKIETPVGIVQDWNDWFTSTRRTADIFGPFSPVAVQDNYTYSFRVRAFDNAGNSDDFVQELSNNQRDEQAGGDPNGANMSRNTLLLHLNEPSGATTFEDSSGNNYDSTCGGIICPAAAYPGNFYSAVRFDGIDDYISSIDTATGDLDIRTGSITIMFWANSSSKNSFSLPISKGKIYPTANCYIIEYNGYEIHQHADKYEFAICHNNGVTSRFVKVNSSYPINTTDGQWHHVVAVYERDADTMQIYVDGRAQNSPIAAGWGATNIDIDGNRRFSVGSRSGEGVFTGSIDEVSVWKRALSANEVMDIYRRGRRLYTTVDITTPVCTMNSLPQYTRNLDFVINWSFLESGSGYQYSRVNYQRDVVCGGGPFGTFDTPVTGTGMSVSGVDACTYSFRCNSTDNVLNTGPYSPFVPTTIDNTSPSSSVNTLLEWINQTSWNVSWSGTDAVSGINCYFVQYRIREGQEQSQIQGFTNWTLDGQNCTTRLSAIFGPNDPTGVVNNRTYAYRTRAQDNAGNLEFAGPALVDTNTTVDTILPEVNISAYDQNGNRIAPPSTVVSAQVIDSVIIILNSTDSISGVLTNKIKAFITDETGERYNETECGNASSYGGVSACNVTFTFGEDTSIRYWSETKDRAENLNTTDTVFIVTHALANFITHDIQMLAGEIVLTQVQVRNMQNARDDVTVSLTGYPYAEFIESEVLAAGGTISSDRRTITISLNPDSQMEFNVRVLSSEPNIYYLNLTANSGINPSLTDTDSVRITINFSASFSEINEWAIALLIVLAVFVFHRSVIRKEEL